MQCYSSDGDIDSRCRNSVKDITVALHTITMFYVLSSWVGFLELGFLGTEARIRQLVYQYDMGSGQENRINGRGDPLRLPHNTLYPQKLALTSPTSGGRSVGIVRLRTEGHGVFFIGQGVRVPFLAGARYSSLLHNIQTSTWSHPVSYPLYTRGSFPVGKAAGMWSWPFTSIYHQG
jgi:hypothetical protein